MKDYLIEAKWGLIFVAMMLLWMYFEHAMGWHGERIESHATYTNFVAIPSVLIYLLALLEKRRRFYKGKMNWKQGFKSGMIITAVVVLFVPFSHIITHHVITPEFFPNMRNYVVAEGLKTVEQAENYFNSTSYLIQGFLGAMVMGALTSAVAALLLRKK